MRPGCERGPLTRCPQDSGTPTAAHSVHSAVTLPTRPGLWVLTPHAGLGAAGCASRSRDDEGRLRDGRRKAAVTRSPASPLGLHLTPWRCFDLKRWLFSWRPTAGWADRPGTPSSRPAQPQREGAATHTGSNVCLATGKAGTQVEEARRRNGQREGLLPSGRAASPRPTREAPQRHQARRPLPGRAHAHVAHPAPVASWRRVALALPVLRPHWPQSPIQDHCLTWKTRD